MWWTVRRPLRQLRCCGRESVPPEGTSLLGIAVTPRSAPTGLTQKTRKMRRRSRRRNLPEERRMVLAAAERQGARPRTENPHRNGMPETRPSLGTGVPSAVGEWPGGKWVPAVGPAKIPGAWNTPGTVTAATGSPCRTTTGTGIHPEREEGGIATAEVERARGIGKGSPTRRPLRPGETTTGVSSGG